MSDFTHSDSAIQERLTAAQCLKNAHNHIAGAYSQIDGLAHSPAKDLRMIRETLDAVDWIRRALEHMKKADAPSTNTGPLVEANSRAKLDEIVEWLIEQGFPFDWNTTIAAPGWLLDELAIRFGSDWGSTGEAEAGLLEAQDFKGRS